VTYPPTGLRPSGRAKRFESIFWPAKTCSISNVTTPAPPQTCAPELQRMLTLTACAYLNQWLGRPTRALVDPAA